MKRISLLILLLPALVFAQTKPKTVVKPVSKTKATIKPAVADATADGFVINGTVKGMPDGTSVALLNSQTGVPEFETTLQKEKFVLKGKIAAPDFKLLTFNKQPPYTSIFLDNSNIKATATKDALDKVSISGSPSHADFLAFTNLVQPYQNVLAEGAPYDSVGFTKAANAIHDFAKTHSNSFINPLAIYRYNQLSEDVATSNVLFNQLSPEVKASPMGAAVQRVLADAMRNADGTILPDFTQTDTAGVPVSLSSLRGKYVLVDFWASWCMPCRQENPNVLQAYNKFKDKNFTVLGVSLDKAKAAWIDAIKMDNLTWTHVSDLQGWANAVAQQNQIQSIPQNFLVDPQGKIVGKNLRGAALERRLEKILR